MSTILLDQKFKAKATSASSSAAGGRYVSHASMACENCRRMKIRCSGSSPCHQCIARKIQDNCEINEERKPRGRRNVIGTNRPSSKATRRDASKRESDSSSGGNDNEMRNEALTTTTSSNQRNEHQLTIVAEKILADQSTAKFLMDVFTRRIHPHLNNLAPFSTLSLDKFFDRTMKPSEAIQRDAGLAMACRMCGHETLGDLLMKRMEMNYKKVKDEPLSHDSYCATALLAASISTVHVSRGLELVLSSFAIHRALFGRKDPIATTCEYLENLSINDSNNNNTSNNHTGEPTLPAIELANALGCNEANGMYNDWASVTKEEITAHVQIAVSQMMNWSQTLEDPELRLFVRLAMEKNIQIAAPPMRPCLVLFIALAVDLHLLGCLVPPYLMEIVHRHDPGFSLGMVGIFKPCAALEDHHALEPCHLNEEITASLLRRVLVARMLFLESNVDPDVIASYVATMAILEIIIQWRGGNRDRAIKIGRWLLEFLERHDLNFWNPTLSSGLLMLGSIFFEMRDGLGLMRIIATLDRLRRSQPNVVVGIEVLRELQQRLITG